MFKLERSGDAGKESGRNSDARVPEVAAEGILLLPFEVLGDWGGCSNYHLLADTRIKDVRFENLQSWACRICRVG